MMSKSEPDQTSSKCFAIWDITPDMSAQFCTITPAAILSASKGPAMKQEPTATQKIHDALIAKAS